MKTTLILLVIALASVCAVGQTVKTEDGRKLDDLKTRIIVFQSFIRGREERLAELRKKYSDDYAMVIALVEEIAQLRPKLVEMEQQQKVLEKKELKRTLPNNTLELQKIIVLQNERIIELLEVLTRKIELP